VTLCSGCRKDEPKLTDAQVTDAIGATDAIEATDAVTAPADVKPADTAPLKELVTDLKVVEEVVAPVAEVITPVVDVVAPADVPKPTDVVTLDAPPVPDVKLPQDVPAK
jgi:hypothetical protein